MLILSHFTDNVDKLRRVPKVHRWSFFFLISIGFRLILLSLWSGGVSAKKIFLSYFRFLTRWYSAACHYCVGGEGSDKSTHIWIIMRNSMSIWYLSRCVSHLTLFSRHPAIINREFNRFFFITRWLILAKTSLFKLFRRQIRIHSSK